MSATHHHPTRITRIVAGIAGVAAVATVLVPTAALAASSSEANASGGAASHPMRVVATAVEERATRLLTTDRGWPEPASLDLPGVLVVV